MDTTDGQGINEDNHKYCPRCQSGPLNIPEYSRSLWKECLQLLKTNTTLTELSIGHSLCCHYGSTLNQQLIDDLLDSLSNNKSIKTLYLDFRGIDQPKQQHPFINEDFISSLLQNNTTIENLYIGCYWEKDLFDGIVKSKPLSSKCLIIDINPVPKPFDQTSWQMSYQFSSKAYQ
ncbi:hypothetical protein CYY_005607 [Polysphondylium violaceum]|nr:hypothetical protein CYY_005607 [Polysphondylium violaceum]